MKTSTQFPQRFNWTAQDLVDAVPLRLSELIVSTFSTGSGGGNDSRFDTSRRRELRGRYASGEDALRLLRVRN